MRVEFELPANVQLPKGFSNFEWPAAERKQDFAVVESGLKQ
ncbi:hypothetical protein [uncultured Sunxiuqinia sp.]|nr:hypothetical protein [uncultured Sunxiuqinia sp.]